MVSQIIDISQYFIVFQCLLLSFYLFTTEAAEYYSNKILGGFLILMGTQMSLLILEDLGSYLIYSLTMSFRFLFGPILYFYVKSVSKKDYRVDRMELLHLVPFIVFFIGISQEWFDSRVFRIAAVNTSAIGYLFLSFISINKYENVILETQSRNDSISLVWLQQLVSFFTVVIIINLINNTFYYEENWPGEVITLVEMAVIFILVNIIVLEGLRYPDIFKGVTDEEIQVANDSKSKYETSALSEADLLAYKERVQNLMKSDKLYMKPDLTLGDLAEVVGITSRELSQVINTQFDKNFSEFVNQHRVEYAIEIMHTTDDSKLTILEILYEVGFNSKSSFYSAFKRFTSMTPKEYQKEHNL